MNAPKKEEASKVKKEKAIICFDHSHFSVSL